MKVKNIAEIIEKIAPAKLAQDWDNVGLLVGNAEQNVKNILLTIDITADVLDEAKKLKAELIISYHPVIWDGLKKITTTEEGGIVYNLIRSNISVISIHTALDVVAGGVNDGLAEIVGINDAKPIGYYVENPADDNYKLIVFVPIKSAAKVSNAVFAVGAGAIGNYDRCSFESEGTGSFRPLENAKPAIGKKGELEKVPEMKFETIVPAKKLESVVAAMKKAHPYETPAFDCIKLHNNPNELGLGRIGKLTQPIKVSQIIEKIKKSTGAKAVGIVGNEKKLVKTAAVCAGSCGKAINSVIAAKADCYITGELKHHQALAAQEAGLTCLCLSHTVSERFILKRVAREIEKLAKNVKIKISKKDADPFRWEKI
ncbi:MAG: Nif3-like dinuclear metal center hexameric protein [Planctomycetes bacterium]|nr:Nif3-like dinuclear metal center hexameric protein [Planctomycetota bacterium]